MREKGRQPKLDAVCLQLEKLARGMGGEARLPTVSQLREVTGASAGTISSALELLQQSDVLYRIQGNGIYVSPRLQPNIALICSAPFFRNSNHSPFWDMLVDFARDWARERNQRLACHLTQPLEQADQGAVALYGGLMDDIACGKVQGVLGVGVEKAEAAWIEAQNVPFVAFAGEARWRVSMTTGQHIRMGAEALAEQGCRSIGLWSAWQPHLVYATDTLLEKQATRELFFRQGLEGTGVSYDASLLRQIALENCGSDGWMTTQSQQEQGFHVAQEVLDQGALPDGVIIADDMMTHGALIALRRAGVRVPGDLRIATQANRGSHVLMGSEEDLILLEYDPREIVQRMFATLETLMAGSQPEQDVDYVYPQLRQESVVDSATRRKLEVEN